MRKATVNANVLVVLTQISPAVLLRILLNRHYSFQSDGKVINLDALVAGRGAGLTEIPAVRAYNPLM